MISNKSTSDFSKIIFDTEEDWEDYAPGIRITDENQSVIEDKKNQIFLYDLINRKTEIFCDYEI